MDNSFLSFFSDLADETEQVKFELYDRSKMQGGKYRYQIAIELSLYYCTALIKTIMPCNSNVFDMQYIE